MLICVSGDMRGGNAGGRDSWWGMFIAGWADDAVCKLQRRLTPLVSTFPNLNGK